MLQFTITIIQSICRLCYTLYYVVSPQRQSSGRELNTVVFKVGEKIEIQYGSGSEPTLTGLRC